MSAAAARTARARATEPAMPELSHRNHFRFGYDGRWFVDRPSPEARWQVAYGRAAYQASDWRAACIDTARLLRAATEIDLWVMFSGGLDSEVALQSFLFAGIPVRAAITRFARDLNRHDIAWAIRFCEAHQVPYRLLDIDIELFFESGAALDYALGAACVQPQLLHTMWAMDQVDGYPILGSAECYLVRRALEEDEEKPQGATPAGIVWEMLEKERIAGWYRHLMHAGREGCAGFFQWDPGNMLAFLRDPMIVALCGDRIVHAQDSTVVKAPMYRRHFLLEQRPKFHGFENVMHLDDALRPVLRARLPGHDAIARTPYAELVGSLAP